MFKLFFLCILSQMERNWQFEANKRSNVEDQLAKAESGIEKLREKVTEIRIESGKFETALEFKNERIADLESQLKKLRK